MNVKLLTKYHLEFLSLKGGCTVSSEFNLVKMPHCWKSHVTAHMSFDMHETQYGPSQHIKIVQDVIVCFVL